MGVTVTSFFARVSGNKMTGPIPNEIGSVSTFWGMNLADPVEGYGLEGTIPSSIGLLSELQLIGAPANKLTGTLPPQLGSLSKLRILDVANNQLTGPAPDNMCEFVEGLVRCFAEDNSFDCPTTCLEGCGVDTCVERDVASSSSLALLCATAATAATVLVLR